MLKKAMVLIACICALQVGSSQAQNFLKKFRSVSALANLGNTVIFAADDGVHGLELWKTDGTADGTVLVKDIAPGAASSGIAGCYTFNGKVYFSANDGMKGVELWRTDGTAQGTELFKDINPQTSSYNSSSPGNFTAVNGNLFFLASEGGAYRGLWRTNGTAAGTIKLVDDNYFGLGQLTSAGNKLYFTLDGNRSLWTSDATVTGTKQVTVDDNYTIDELHAVNNELVFITNTSYRQSIRLYKLTPQTNTTALLKSYSAVTYGSLDIGNITAVGSGFFFSIRTVDASDQGNDALWKSDGTPGGTQAVKAFAWKRYISNSYMQNFISFKDKLYFAVTSTYALYSSDGSEAGTVKISDTQLAADKVPVIADQKMYFASNGLWTYDGAAVKKELEQPATADQLFEATGKVYFVSVTTAGAELWNNAPQAQITVTRNFQTLDNGSTANFTSRVDSAAVSAVTIKNIGNKELTLSEISVTGGSFYVNGKPSQTIMPGKQVAFNLLYYPVKEEQLTGTLQIKSNNSNAGSFTAYLSGTAAGTATNRNAAPAEGLAKAIQFKDTLSLFALSNSTILEKQPAGTAVGEFSMAGGSGTYAFSLVSGTGDNDNGSFQLSGSTLKTLKLLNFAGRNTYTLRVRATNGTDSFEKVFVVSVGNVQENLATEVCGNGSRILNYSLNDAVYLGSRIVAAGTGGNVLTSDNNGQDWKVTPTGMSVDFTQVLAPGGQTAYMLGANSTLLKTENGGDSWFPLASPDVVYPYLSGMYFYSADVGYLFGDSKLYKTTDGGKSWKKLTTGTYNSLNAAWFITEDTGFICGTSQTLQRTRDGGKTWETVALPAIGFNTNLVKIVFTTNKIGYMASAVGDILQTTDGGSTWTRISTISANQVIRLRFITEQEGYCLTGYNGSVLYKTIDAGRTWTRENISSPGAFTGIAVNKGGDQFCVVGHGVGLGYTSRHGSCIYLKAGSGAWTARSLIGNGTFSKLIFTDAQTVYLFGSTTLKSMDAGLTWMSMNVPADSYNSARTASFIDQRTGYTANLNEIYKTADAGEHWEKITTDRSSSISLVHFTDANTGFYSTGAGLLFKTIDGGKSWNQKALGTGMGGLRYMQFFDQQNGYLLPLGGKFYKTVDGGETWSPMEVGGSYFLLCAHFINKQIGFAGGTNGTLLRTADGGQTWVPATLGITSLSFAAFTFVDATHGYAIANNNNGGSSEMYETLDAGISWQKIATANEGWLSIALAGNKVYIAGDYGTLLQLADKPAPANAGYIAGETKTVAGIRYLYSVPAVPGTYYNWTASGAGAMEYQNNVVSVIWKQGGKVNLQVTPYNSCSNGEPRALPVDVQEMPDPVIIGPAAVLSQSADIEYTTTNRNNTYSWAASGAITVVPDQHKAKVSWGNAGTGKVTVVEYNQDLGLKKSATLDVTIKEPDHLPSTNFKVAVTSLSCKGSNNGMVTVTAGQSLSYVAAVTGPAGYSRSFDFSTELQIRDLGIGAYTICISVPGGSYAERCYTVTMTEPKDLAVYAQVEQSTGTVKLSLSGAEKYYVEMNGQHIETSSSQLNVKLSNGANNLKVYTDKECQGISESKINFNNIVLYPNPVVDVLNIDLAGNVAKTAAIQIRTLSGRLIYSKNYDAGMNAVLNVNMAEVESGIYVLKLSLNSQEYIYKVIKK